MRNPHLQEEPTPPKTIGYPKSQMDSIVGATMYNRGGRWEEGLLNLFDRVLKTYHNTADHAIVDIGANFGAFSLYAASKVSSDERSCS